MLATLRKSGGSLVLTIPKLYIEQNGLTDGSPVHLEVEGKELLVKAESKPHYKLADLMAEMPEELPMVDGWDELVPVGQELA